MEYHAHEPPFQLGETLKGTESSTGTAVLINNDKLGIRCAFPHVDYSITGLTTARSLLSGEKICAIALRNTAGIALLPKRLVLLDVTAGYGMLKNADGYAHDLAIGPCVLVDPWLPSAGCADDDIFWGIYAGPAMCLTPTVAADFSTAIAAGAPLVAATGTTSGNSTGGRVSNITLPGQTGATAAFSMAQNLIGYALSARTTDVTNSDILVRLAVKI